MLGNRSDMRPSNLITLCGSGTTGCHGWVHGHPREARLNGWIVSKYRAAETVSIPVLYGQPDRAGWHTLTDDHYVLAA